MPGQIQLGGAQPLKLNSTRLCYQMSHKRSRWLACIKLAASSGDAAHVSELAHDYVWYSRASLRDQLRAMAYVPGGHCGSTCVVQSAMYLFYHRIVARTLTERDLQLAINRASEHSMRHLIDICDLPTFHVMVQFCRAADPPAWDSVLMPLAPTLYPCGVFAELPVEYLGRGSHIPRGTHSLGEHIPWGSTSPITPSLEHAP